MVIPRLSEDQGHCVYAHKVKLLSYRFPLPFQFPSSVTINKNSADISLPIQEHHQCGGSYDEWTEYNVVVTHWVSQSSWRISGTVQDGISDGAAGEQRPYDSSGHVEWNWGKNDRLQLTLVDTLPSNNQGCYSFCSFEKHSSKSPSHTGGSR